MTPRPTWRSGDAAWAGRPPLLLHTSCSLWFHHKTTQLASQVLFPEIPATTSDFLNKLRRRRRKKRREFKLFYRQIRANRFGYLSPSLPRWFAVILLLSDPPTLPLRWSQVMYIYTYYFNLLNLGVPPCVTQASRIPRPRTIRQTQSIQSMPPLDIRHLTTNSPD